MTPPRRWSFGIRTLLLAVAVLAGPLAWVGYSLNWIHQRHAFLSQGPGGPSDDNPGHLEFVETPRSLRLFGERGFADICLPGNYPPGTKLFDEAERLFPEARVWWFGDVVEKVPTH